MSVIEPEALRRGNPAARALPLLTSVAKAKEAAVVLEHTSGNHLRIQITPTEVHP